jgi:hypothetical protein
MADESEDDEVAQAKAAFALCEEDPADNRQSFIDDMRFVRLREHWPDRIQQLRRSENRPCLTIDRLGPVIRQVVNDSRQNKPSIKVHPVDSGADKKTAEVIDGLIRNIEYSSNADVAYDTSVECAVGGGFGYFRIKADYAREDAFHMDLSIERIANPLCVFPDPNSTAADSSDWNVAFIVNRITKDQYKAEYGDAEQVDWTSDVWEGGWLTDEGVLIAEWWTREEYEKTIVKTADGKVFDEQQLKDDPDLAFALEKGLIQIAETRKTKCHRVTQRILSGEKVLKTTKWPGRYIPIIPVYGDEFWIEGKRYLRSLVHGAKDAQMMFDVMRSAAVEMFGTAPKVPFIGPKGAFDHDIKRWNTVNQESHPFLEYTGGQPPIRLPLDPGPAAGAMTEALSASDDIKSITGIYDASLGQRSNETSGRAIMARQREGDTSTFHFIDNLRRAIRHAGRVLVDLIPHFYDHERVVRVIGEDGKEDAVQVNKEYPQLGPDGRPMQKPVMGPNGQPVMQPNPQTGQMEPLMEPVLAMHDLTTGKYDVTVSSGPSFTTRREEAAYSMTEALRAFPQGAGIIMPELAKNLDWPGADKIAEKLEQQASNQLPPQVQKLIEEGKKKIGQLTEENQKLKMDRSIDQEQLQADIAAEQAKADAEYQIEQIRIASQERIARNKIESEARIAAYKAQLSAQAEAQRPIVQPRAA